MDEKDLQRLKTARNFWLATVRANGSPHLVPIWFVWLNDKVYLHTSRKSVKARNILQNPRGVFALEDGDDPVVIEGEAKILEDVPVEVAAAILRAFAKSVDRRMSFRTE